MKNKYQILTVMKKDTWKNEVIEAGKNLRAQATAAQQINHDRVLAWIASLPADEVPDLGTSATQTPQEKSYRGLCAQYVREQRLICGRRLRGQK